MNEKLIDMNLSDYLDVLRSDAPAPGGGSVSALAGAEGAGLLIMVCDLTIGKEKYAEYEDVCREAKSELAGIYDELRAGIDKDTEAFNLVSNAFKMPKDTDADKEARSGAIQQGTIVATEVPLHNMELAYQALEIADKLLGRYNLNCGSDYGVAVLNLRACVLGAWMNVKINLSGIKDEQKVKDYEDRAAEIATSSGAIAERLYEEAAKAL